MDEIFQVAVLGAGLAGLVAARELSAAGFRVVLLEARDRVGGRTFSRSLPNCDMMVDLGAEWVAPRFHTAMVTELKRYGLPLVSPDPVDEQNPAAAVDPAWTALLAEIDQDAQRIDPSKPDWYRDVTAFEMPLQQYLQQLGVPTHLQHELLPHAFALHGAHHGQYSATNLLHDVAAFGGCEQAFHADERRIAGGSQALAQRIAADIGCELRLGWPVTTVGQSGDEVVISGPRGAVRASCAVLAVPVNVLADLALHLTLPTMAQSAIAEGHPGRAAKGWKV
ncbi:MAG: FAD-dependent oxidoreductase, partial [Cellvibrionales bacterium]